MTMSNENENENELPRVEMGPVPSLRAGDRVTYKKKVGTVLSIGGMGFVRVFWDGQSRRSDVQASTLKRVDARPTQWDQFLGRKPTKLDELSAAHDVAMKRWGAARKRRERAWVAEEKAYAEEQVAWKAWLAESERLSGARKTQDEAEGAADA